MSSGNIAANRQSRRFLVCGRKLPDTADEEVYEGNVPLDLLSNEVLADHLSDGKL